MRRLVQGRRLRSSGATGHSSHSYVAIVTDEAWLAKNNFVEMLNDYIDSAPKNFAQEKKWKRYHGTNSNDLSYYTSGGDGQYKRQVPSDDPHFIDHPDAATKALFEYNDDIIEGDRAASYKSAKYPWLLHGAKSTFILRTFRETTTQFSSRFPRSQKQATTWYTGDGAVIMIAQMSIISKSQLRMFTVRILVLLNRIITAPTLSRVKFQHNVWLLLMPTLARRRWRKGTRAIIPKRSKRLISSDWGSMSCQ